MSYIAPTRQKKLKKLFLLSFNIIREWGWKYFFYTVQKEWKEKGLSIFLPDEKPIPLFARITFQEQYEKYLKSIEEKSLKIFDSTLPQISFLLFYEPKEIKNLQITLTSFVNQSYDNWNVFLISKNNDTLDSSILPQDKRISLISNHKNSLILDKINSVDSDFFGILDSNILIHNYSVLELIKFLKKNPDSDIYYSDNDHIGKNNHRSDPFFKPNWSLITFNSYDYISSFYIVQKKLLKKVLKNEFSNLTISFNLLLHFIELAKQISHIPLPLYSIMDYSILSSYEFKKNLLKNFIQRNNIDAKVEYGALPQTFRINYNLKSKPKVSIFIPTTNNYSILKRCIKSIEKNTNYKNIEIIIIDNPKLPNELSKNSKLTKYYNQTVHKVITYNDNFNFSRMNNIAVKESTGDLLLFLNDDTKILDKYWLDEMVSILLQDDIGAVGPKLVFGDETIQHAGMAFLKTGSGFHPFQKLDHDAPGYHNFANIMKECSAVTGACLLTSREIFEQIGEYDENFDVYYGDSDLCLKIRKAGYKIVYTPFTKLLHDGSRTIRSTIATSYFAVESHQRFLKKWPELKNGDPFYHPILDWDYSMPDLS